MKYSTSTYLKNITKYKLYLYRNNNKFITIKKIINIIEPVGTNHLLSERGKIYIDILVFQRILFLERKHY